MGVWGNRDLYLYNCLKKINEEKPVDLSTLDKRVEFQKKVYLLKSLGLSLNYKYGSYIKGPYSSSLAEVGFNIYESPKDSIPENLDEIVPIGDEIEKINLVKTLIDNLPRQKNESYWLELISSLHFLRVNAYPPVRTWENAKSRLARWKPNKFSEMNVEKAIALIEEYKLLG